LVKLLLTILAIFTEHLDLELAFGEAHAGFAVWIAHASYEEVAGFCWFDFHV
jgi:hypothetical protein